MLNASRVLIASHGTPGARAAELAALELAAPGAAILHLVVVPDFWKGMMGDDWLNNASTRAAYGRHVESQLAQEIEQHRIHFEREIRASGRHYEIKVVIGKPDEALLEYAAAARPDLVVIGAPRPRGTPGLRSRMRVEKLIGALAVALVVIPHPR
ncbi:MAG TPA: universal stress protein [Burkholderiales bacterium]|nr:universal stress protein [Burkholderiales bacterium]